MRNNVLSAGIIFTLISSVSNHFNQYMMKDDVILMLIDLIKCIFLNFAVSLTFPVARDPRVVLNECPSKKKLNLFVIHIFKFDENLQRKYHSYFEASSYLLHKVLS